MAGVGMVALFLPGMLFIYVMADAPGVLDSSCDVDDDCELNLSCIKLYDCPVGTCSQHCHDDLYTWNTDLKKCVPEVDLGASCEQDSECKTIGATCSGGICKCATGRRGVYDNRYCASENDRLLGEPCGSGECIYKLYGALYSNGRDILQFSDCKGGECACHDGLKIENDGCSPRMVGEECQYVNDCSQGGCVSGSCECLLGQKQVDNRCVSLSLVGNQGNGETCASDATALDRLCQEDLICVRCPEVGEICTIYNTAAILGITAVWWSLLWTIGILYLSM